MKDGKTFEGKYLGGSATQVRWQFSAHGNQVRDIATNQVVAIEFSAAATSPQPSAQASPGASITIPKGHKLIVTFAKELSSRKTPAGSQFKAQLEGDLIVNGVIVARDKSQVLGKVVGSSQSGRLVGRSSLALVLSHVKIDGKLYPIETSGYAAVGKSQAMKTGRNAALGAAVGGAFGGKKGAQKGAALGAAGSVLTRGSEIKIPAGTILEFEVAKAAKVKGTK